MPMPAPQEPPMGASSATGPTPNRGLEAAGMQKLALIVKGMTELLPLLGAGSEPGQAVLDALKKLSKYVQPGSVTPAAEQNQLQSAMMNNIQNSAMIQQMRQQMRQQAVQQGAGGPPAGARAA